MYYYFNVPAVDGVPLITDGDELLSKKANGQPIISCWNSLTSMSLLCMAFYR